MTRAAQVTAPLVAATRDELARMRDALPGRVAVVMTMGALHDGHVALVDRARELADHVIVTIFVNPLQFAAGEDLDRYPRTLADDLDRLAGRADLVFTPGPDVVYPGGPPRVRVNAGELGELLEGAHRPGHFDGVLTVVTVLLHLVRPDVAVFGEKDAQQLALVRHLVADLALATRIEAVPTVRDPDGLALSSRNAYLDGDQRQAALAVPKALAAAAAAARAGGGPRAVRRAAAAVLVDSHGVDVDYVEVVHPDTFAPAGEDRGGEDGAREDGAREDGAREDGVGGDGTALVVVAVRVGGTRLVDNVAVTLAT